LSEAYEVTLIANFELADIALNLPANVRTIHVPIVRKIMPFADLYALVKLIRVLWKGQFNLVHSVTPKAGLLAMLASKLTGVEHRIHTFTGQVWVTKRGIKRALLKSFDKLISKLASSILVDSPSQHEFLVAERVISSNTSSVLGAGSISGVDTVRFCPNDKIKSSVRERLGISQDAIVLLFLGRLNVEKGVTDLATAFSMLERGTKTIELLFVGPDEDSLRESLEEAVGEYSDMLHFVSYTNTPEEYMVASDVFCLPSYREGFGSVVIEAAACGVPAIGSSIYGITDAIVKNQTGLLFHVGDATDLSSQLQRLIDDPNLRQKMGENAMVRADEQFSQNRLTHELTKFYRSFLPSRQLSE